MYVHMCITSYMVCFVDYFSIFNLWRCGLLQGPSEEQTTHKYDSVCLDEPSAVSTQCFNINDFFF